MSAFLVSCISMLTHGFHCDSNKQILIIYITVGICPLTPTVIHIGPWGWAPWTESRRSVYSASPVVSVPTSPFYLLRGLPLLLSSWSGRPLDFWGLSPLHACFMSWMAGLWLPTPIRYLKGETLWTQARLTLTCSHRCTNRHAQTHSWAWSWSAADSKHVMY